MSDTTSTQAAPPAEGAEPTTDQQQGEPAELGEAGKKALAAERDARKAAEKEAANAKAELDQIKRAQMSDLERAQSDVKELQEKLAAAPKQVAEDLRPVLTSLYDIAEKDASLYLTSEDPKTLLEQALGIASKRGAATSPKPDLSQAGSGAPMPLNGDPLEQALRSKLGM